MTTATVSDLESTTTTDPHIGYSIAVASDGAPTGWVDVCPIDAILPDTGVCALVNGNQIAVFHLRGGEVHAVGNLDPFSNAAVLSRGIVGDRCGVPKVASPVYKQSFDLRSGTCLDDSSARIPVYGARVTAGTVQVSVSPER
jgi:nitrite reductase (NADH) small subunit